MDKAEALYQEIIEGYEERKYMAEQEAIELIREYTQQVSREKAINFAYWLPLGINLNQGVHCSYLEKRYDKWESNQEESK